MWVSPEEFKILKEIEKAKAVIAVRDICPDRSNECNANQKCVLISRCTNECIGVTQGLLQTDKQVLKYSIR